MTTSRVRRSLDALLARYHGYDVVSIDWQIERLPPDVIAQDHPLASQGPWVLVELGQPSETFDEMPAWAIWQFAIFKATGAVHSMRDGAVSDDPIDLYVGGSHNLPMPTSYANVAIVLRNMADHVEAGDSFEGSIEYLLPDVPDWAQRGEPPPADFTSDDVLMRCSYRVGNRHGQGGLRIIGSINEPSEP
jgi:hypothetical protein